MAKVIYMDDLGPADAPFETPVRTPMFSVDAREVLRLRNPRYRTSTNQGAAVVAEGAREALAQLEKPEDRLSHVDVRPTPRAGVRGGDLSAGGVTPPPAPTTPVAPVADPGLASVVPQGPLAVPGVLVPSAAAVSEDLTHAQPADPTPPAPADGEGSGFLG